MFKREILPHTWFGLEISTLQLKCWQRNSLLAGKAAPATYADLATNRFIATMCTQKEAAVVARENRVMIPSSCGKNCGEKSPVAQHAL